MGGRRVRSITARAGILLALTAVAMLGACSDAPTPAGPDVPPPPGLDSGTARLRLINVTPATVEFLVDGNAVASVVDVADTSVFTEVPVGSHRFMVRIGGEVLGDVDATLEAHTEYAVIAAGISDSLSALLGSDTAALSAAGAVRLRVIYTPPGAPPLNIYLTVQGTRAPAAASFLEGRRSNAIADVAGMKAGHLALADVAHETAAGAMRMVCHDVGTGRDKRMLEAEPWKGVEHGVAVVTGHLGHVRAHDVGPGAHRNQRDFRPLVSGDGQRVHGDAIPDDGTPLCAHATLPQECFGRDGALDLERHLAGEPVRQPQVVQDAGEIQQFLVIPLSGRLADQGAQQSGAHGMVEQVRGRHLAGQLHGRLGHW